MTTKCKHCGSEIDAVHITERIDRDGETVERHYCSDRCFAKDKGYSKDIPRPDLPDLDDPFPDTDPDPRPDPKPTWPHDDIIISNSGVDISVDPPP